MFAKSPPETQNLVSCVTLNPRIYIIKTEANVSRHEVVDTQHYAKLAKRRKYFAYNRQTTVDSISVTTVTE